MTCKQDAQTDLITLSSVGVRIAPVARGSVHTGNLYEMQATSAETNVLSVGAALGLSARVLTRFVAGSPIALWIRSDLRRRGIVCEGPDVPQGGPWGFRHQFNIADSGFGVRGPRVLNDRAGEVGLTLNPTDYDLHRLFQAEGCRVLHLSGLVAALSAQTAACCLVVARAAKAAGTKISFDLNYRASFWKGRETELRQVFLQIASMADILVGNEEDFQLALGIKGPAAGGRAIEDQAEGFRQMIRRAQAQYPGTSVFATTLREVVTANTHRWGALMLAENTWYAEPLRDIPVFDRIGGGDAFVGGLLYAMLRNWPAEQWLQFGWATGALTVASAYDYATPADEEQVWNAYTGDARVRR
ncbi:MAG: sugar kinase [Oscillospiraceae bacterium]|jgi:2-dehydro-3-deoxygluconokinase|nr:sugar kinase [Oscillospiraceae bacterium]